MQRTLVGYMLRSQNLLFEIKYLVLIIEKHFLSIFAPENLITYFQTFFPLSYSVRDTIPVSQVGGRGSIPYQGGFMLFSFFCPIFTHFGGFLNPKKGVTLPSYTYGTFCIHFE